jgi:hypothetical protein
MPAQSSLSLVAASTTAGGTLSSNPMASTRFSMQSAASANWPMRRGAAGGLPEPRAGLYGVGLVAASHPDHADEVAVTNYPVHQGACRSTEPAVACPVELAKGFPARLRPAARRLDRWHHLVRLRLGDNHGRQRLEDLLVNRRQPHIARHEAQRARQCQPRPANYMISPEAAQPASGSLS